ncbi:Dyp-type peroxidase [Corynebacterium qintianiae]|uniref:Dyp-type peroxidase n=1 Tax=Corynebacterium qintianiae TaxID=2709392 RepID=A0A7T0KL16_9CORY|nr:Dyp-type peroxidase [Corynebacterium qintianiae]QPK82477.1 Dyp-type peroxidase [Corynebacterium qintianiae]
MTVSRRLFLAGSATAATAASAGALASCSKRDAGGASTSEPPSNSDDTPQPLRDAIVEFDGPHQAGIDTPTQASLNLIGFNLRERADGPAITRLMRVWTADARALCSGETPLGSLEPEMNEWPANLTITCGFGERVFDIAAPGRKPEWLHDIPEFTRDQLEEKWGQTDLVLQICSDDPVMGAWAMRHMTRAGMDYVDTKWVQQGFMNAYGAIPKGQTPRNLFGQVDGTVNPHADEEFAEQVWIDEPEGVAGSTSLVVRRIAMNLDEWELLDRASREEAVGRTLDDGSPLTGGDEFAAPDMEATDQYGLPVIDKNSHMARAMPPADHPEQRFKRRPYNYNLPPEPGSGALSNAGLIFIAFQKNPDTQFTPVQARLDEVDRLNTWTTHIGSAVYWVPPGTSSRDGGDEYWGQSVLEA